MTVFDWLSSPIGIEATHAVILLITAVSAYVSYKARQAASAASIHTAETRSLLADHVADVKDHAREVR